MEKKFNLQHWILSALENSAVRFPQRKRVDRVLIGLACFLGANFLRTILDPKLGGSAPFVLFDPVIMIGTWYGGLRVGMMLVGLCVLSSAYLWMEPRYTFAFFENHNFASMTVFVVVALVLMFFAHFLRVSLARSRQANREQNGSQNRVELQIPQRQVRIENKNPPVEHSVRRKF